MEYQPISAKIVYDINGTARCIQLCQGTNIITLDHVDNTMDRDNGIKWREVKECVDTLVESLKLISGYQMSKKMEENIFIPRKIHDGRSRTTPTKM